VRLGVSSGVLILTAALTLAGCGGGGDSAAKANATAATTVVGTQRGGGSTSAAGGAATGSTRSPQGTATSKPPGSAVTGPQGTTPSTSAATPTTRLDTIKPIPGRSAPPFYDYNASTIASASPATVNGQLYGVCRGTPPTTEVILTWQTYYTDYVQINRVPTNYPPNDNDVFYRAPCETSPAVRGAPRANVTFTLFGPGGETTANASIFVEANYQP
jgi:hypothetical protein